MWSAAFSSERAIRVGSALVRAFGFFVVHPSVNDDAALAVVTKEQPILLEELCSEPVLVLIAERYPLSILGASRVLRNYLEGELYNGRQPLRCVLAGILFRILGARVESSGALLLGQVGERLAGSHDFYAAFASSEEWQIVQDGRALGMLPIDR